ncbi:MAG: hypothetical protein HUJ70_04535 [Pseudobutyrivibrio sp.]|nr:hypothetical protein [Pseudobutyrivibrio sp.]
MSQAKVDKNKELKANRAKIVKKKRIEYIASLVCVSVIAIAVLGWIGFSIYTKASAYAQQNAEVVYNEVNTDALTEYLSNIE